jgi:hypothetical protein
VFVEVLSAKDGVGLSEYGTGVVLTDGRDPGYFWRIANPTWVP